jgi:hypothetical protein
MKGNMEVSLLGFVPIRLFLRYQPHTDPQQLTESDFVELDARGITSFTRRCFDFELGLAGLDKSLASERLYVGVQRTGGLVLRKYIIEMAAEPREGQQPEGVKVLGSFLETIITTAQGDYVATERKPL